MNAKQLAGLKAAMKKDFAQYMIDQLTPSRGYTFPADNVIEWVKLMGKEQPK